MGCLINIWLGDYERDKNNHGTMVEYPKYISCTLKNTELENPGEWQEVETKSSLGKKILMYYPDINPVFDERGILIDVIIPKLEEKKQKQEQERQEKKEEAKARGYKNRTNIRPKNLLPFLQLNQ